MASKTREMLIEVARQLFLHKGVAKTTMNDIANASARGRRTIYTYFRNKKEIYNAVLESESENMVQSLRRIIARKVPVDERLRDFIYFRLEHNNVQVSSLLITWLKFDSRRVERINRMVHEKESDMLARLLDEGCRDGVFSPDRCRLLSQFLDESLNRLNIPVPTPETLERRKLLFSSFVEFIISDIKAR
ncbi:MAG: TetR family transcriptional regulator [Odoribacter sp.]|nr:TetR family transcriptional regulator [Odoribacter sp.]